MQKVLTLLYVCEGNVCRSPAAAAMAGAWFDDARVTVTSAGLRALAGQPIDQDVSDALDVFDVTADGHRARQYDEAMTREADLVLTSTRAQSARVLRDQPQAFRRVFTVREFARLVASTARPLPRDLVAAVAAVAAMRGHVPASAPEDDDLTDPYRRGAAASRAMVNQLAPAVGEGLLGLGLSPRQRRAVPDAATSTRPRPRPRPRPRR